MVPDGELLQRYLRGRDDDAFRELVDRYIGLVYAAARRQVLDPHLAEDVTQMVFVRLSRKSVTLGENSVLAGWLHADTRLTALQVLRQERRRLNREDQAMSPQDDQITESTWSDVSPLIDEALGSLPTLEREAVLLRILQGRSFSEVGDALGIGADAARMRVNRALDKLQAWLRGHGLESSSAGLLALLTAYGVAAPPVSLAAAVVAQAITHGAGAGMIGGILMTKAKIIAGTAIVLSLAVPVIIQQRRNQTLRARGADLEQQLQQMRDEGENSAAKLRAASAEAATVPGLRADIARLRGELDRLRASQASSPPGVAGASNTGPKNTPKAEQKPLTEEDIVELLARPAADQGRLFGELRAAGFSRGIDNLKEHNRNFELAQRVRPELEKLEQKPEDYAAFQTEFIKAVAGVSDETKLGQMRQLLQETYQQMVADGLDAPSKPQGDSGEWALKRDALDRPATRALEALLSEEEKSKFGHAFLGVIGIDLGIGDGGWHRFKNEQGGFIFPSEAKAKD